jgi:hypothetical protein
MASSDKPGSSSSTSNSKKKKEDDPAAANNNNSARRGNSSSSSSSNSSRGGFLTKYFLVILFVFACVSLFLNTRFTHIIVEEVSTIEQFLEKSVISRAAKEVASVLAHSELLDPESSEEGSDDETRIDAALSMGAKHHDLNCDAFGGPDRLSAQEMVYWKDIPSDARHISPFHHSLKEDGHPRQFMTFEPDQGGWNNIRMAMETVLVRTMYVYCIFLYCTRLVSKLSNASQNML